ncbi:hypothetical protein ABZ942_19815 [Nocardia sp. NPDC046473]|uniref:hypothetical protein n=1 Tax=Nocardia sp. NPDC046473 TaxID=3155733 RepID=UPI00340B8392
MEREHEEAMRTEFVAADRLNAKAFRDHYAGRCTETEFQQQIEQGAEIDDRWVTGPYREQWIFLRNACDGWHLNPERMQRELAADGLDDVQRRSLEQAQEIEQDRASRRQQLLRQYERSRQR